MAVVTFSPVGGEMEVDCYGDYVLIDSYLALEVLNRTLKEQIETLEKLVSYYRTTIEDRNRRDNL